MHVPGWHEATEHLQRAGTLQMLGIIQEQNADRCRLFMQWKEMDWPILVDTFDLLEVSVVPLTYAIDEHGIVRFAGLRLSDAAGIEETFVARTWPAPAAADSARSSTPGAGALSDLLGRASTGDAAAIGEAVTAFHSVVESDPGDGWAHFRLAAAYRLRHDAKQRRPGDFQRAVDHWQTALEIDPNNYIWRRRIQQYGPRLAKPYPFYDWIEPAREAIVARGETPVPLGTEPTGSEVAQPSSRLAAETATFEPPDSAGRVDRDAPVGAVGTLIRISVTAVPRKVRPGQASRVHLRFAPNGDRQAHWNNETEPLRVWVDAPPGWRLDRPLLEVPNAPTATSTEIRSPEVEVHLPRSVRPGPVRLPAYALYYVCEDRDGTCLYRRQDLAIEIEVLGDG